VEVGIDMMEVVHCSTPRQVSRLLQRSDGFATEVSIFRASPTARTTLFKNALACAMSLPGQARHQSAAFRGGAGRQVSVSMIVRSSSMVRSCCVLAPVKPANDPSSLNH
jgi:hypothetical protein